jgi:XTP/dITP diphosphohydrolase
VTGIRLLLATRNPGKLREFRGILVPLGFDVVDPVEAGYREEVTEDGATLRENAVKKAEAAARATGLAAVADDTGLFVDALAGAPGVHSARWAGEEQDPAANCAKLLRALDGVPDDARGASFRCVIALARPGAETLCFDGECRGWIGRTSRGSGGFGYDPLFVVGPGRRTFAELEPGEKHRMSHRGRALRRMEEYVQALAENHRP